MVLEQADSTAEAHPVTPMAEIRRHQGMLFEDFVRAKPGWIWNDQRRRECLMYDEQGRAWVPMFDPEYGVGYAYPEDLTPEAEAYLDALGRKALEDVRAGRGDVFDSSELDE